MIQRPPRIAGGLALLLLLLAGTAAAQQPAPADMLAAYARAERYLRPNLERLVLNVNVEPNWLGSDELWYRRQLADGAEFVLVDAARGTSAPAFDHARVARALAAASGRSHTATTLPFERFTFTDGRRAIRFTVDGTTWECSLERDACERRPAPAQAGSALERRSPDGRWTAFLHEHDIHLRAADDGGVVRLSDDGEPWFDYAGALASPVAMIRRESPHSDVPVAASWSPDARRLITYRLDQRQAQRFTLVQSTPSSQLRPIAYTYAYPLPGEEDLTRAHPVIFEVDTGRRIAVAVEPIPLLYYGSGPNFTWSANGERLRYTHVERGWGRVQLREIDARTGALRVIIDESSDTRVHRTLMRVLDDGAEIIWASERDGWNHLYLYDGERGELKNRITAGAFAVREIVAVDEAQRQIYFTAGGREAGRDPYYRHLYRVDFDGSGLVLLTPEDADHEISMSPGRRFFVDAFSRVDLPTITVLRRASDGAVVMELERAGIDALLATGWTMPERFQGTARDGETDIYGVIWRPANFDTTRRYPVIEQIYTGPHNFHAPVRFVTSHYYDMEPPAIAELGFIVVMVDGFGTPGRSKAFHDRSYRDLGDAGLVDHIAWIRQAAARYPQLDLSRGVGIFGHSAGGYDSTRGMLMHPDFYTVGVSSAGNHDHRLDKASWVERWMDVPVGDHYVQQSNATLAHRLQGRLLLVHGELDENVHPSSSLQVVAALVQANRDFDMLILPNRLHRLYDDPYFLRRRWDFFVEHLLGATPPRGYRIEAWGPPRGAPATDGDAAG